MTGGGKEGGEDKDEEEEEDLKDDTQVKIDMTGVKIQVKKRCRCR